MEIILCFKFQTLSLIIDVVGEGSFAFIHRNLSTPYIQDLAVAYG